MSEYKFETLQLHVGQEQADPATDSRAVPIYATTSYVFHNSEHAAARFGLTDAGNIYGRLTNSTQDVLEKRVAALEGGVAALALASGAAAITYTIEALATKGEHIVAQKTIYGGSYNLLAHTLPLYGIETSFVNIHDLSEVEAAIQDNTKALYIETLGNPNSDIPDIDALAEIAHKRGIPLVIDNTFGTPYLIRPIEHGADIVVHSATKFLGGDLRAQPQLPRGEIHRRCRSCRLRHLHPGDPAPGHRCSHLPICSIPAAPGRGNAVPPSGTPRGEHKKGGGVPQQPSPGGGRQPPLAAGPSGPCPL